jgi:hypothetical protein
VELCRQFPNEDFSWTDAGIENLAPANSAQANVVEATLLGVIRLLGILFLSALFLGCSGDDDTPPASSPGATPHTTARPGATFVPGGSTPEPPGSNLTPLLQLTGVFAEAQPVAVSEVVNLSQRPQAQFKAWDGGSVVLFDTQTGVQHNLGPGRVSSPSFGGGYFVYTGENAVWLVDLATMQKQSLGHGLVAYFLGDQHIVINPGDNQFVMVDVKTGVRTPVDQVTDPLLRSMLDQRWGGEFRGSWLDNRYVARHAKGVEESCPGQSLEKRKCSAGASESWRIDDLSTGETVLAFDANQVAVGGPNEVVIATSPVCDDGGPVSCYDLLSRLEAQSLTAPVFVQGRTNIFIVDVETGQAQFVATATYNAGVGKWPMHWPLVANDQYVVWTESYCGNPQGVTRIYVRATGEIVDLNESQWVTLSGSLLGLGEHGAKALFDLKTRRYVSVLPDQADVNWSPDFRYGAVGQEFGKSGVCG